jgi:Tol biopolymer transport system component
MPRAAVPVAPPPIASSQGAQLDPTEPVKVPVINIFGELDGQQANSQPQSGDYGFQQHTFSDEGFDSDCNVDPSGKWIVFSSTRNSERSEIYLQRVDGTSVTELTSDLSDNAQPCFSPDGKSVAFCSTRAGSWDLYTMDIDGRNVAQVTSGPGQDMHPSFSPDGTRLVYSSIGSRSGQWELWTVNLSTRERKMIGYGLFPSWSPDKKCDRIAFQRARQRGSRWFSLWTLDLLDGEARKVTEIAVSSNAAIISPCWSPDGKRLAFATVVDPAKTAKGKPRGQQDIWVVDCEGGSRHRLTDGTSTCLTPCWANDGRVYFVSDRGGHENVWSVRTERAHEWPVAVRPMKDGPGPAPAAPKTAVGSTGGELEK